jgi:hypothetical protein
MNTTKHFSDNLFTLGFRVGYWFSRRAPAKTAAVEPDRADSLKAPVATLDWFAPSTGPAQTWADFASAADVNDAANPTHH